MHPVIRATLAALICAPVVGAAQAPDAARAGERPHAPGEGLRRADANQDGKVSFEELRAQRPNVTQEAFGRMDQNGDGFLTAADRPEGQRGARGPQGADDTSRRQLLDKLMASDADQDGKVSFAEIESAKPGFARSDFDRLDRDSDGYITKSDAPKTERTAADRPRAPRGPDGARGMVTPEQRAEFRERLRGADKNADGKVTFSEAQTALPQMTQERFDALDRNKDGAIGPEDRPQRDGQRTPPAP